MKTISPGAGAAVNGFRTAVAAIGVGAAALAGLYFTHQTHQLSRSAQYTERFSKAMEMLADKEEARQLGGVYALERIMRDSPYDRPAIIETLAGFIRLTSPAPSEDAQSFIESKKSPVPESARAAFYAIARRAVNPGDPEIDLSRCDLRLLHCKDANLVGVNFSRSDLRQSFFERGNLRESYFMGARLDHVWFSECDLTGSKFPEARIGNCMFDDSVLDEANFAVADDITEDSLTVMKSYAGAIFPWTD
ncbi:pentapeptide repeat-containing protein [Streptomyces sp. SID9124]|uniref:pentapeptide repeat-containing protein n=1 Tax=Streptomyces sp. SID9124 TaxID=2706108 RepID=UPI0013E0E5A9|nr:pentapeptide repeat-containing protein [Streptomyces sp. SID9124]NED15803.1 pentapeptide repeat-containing protein [Streptomyces sp. SID9124]